MELNDRAMKGQRKDNHWLTNSITGCCRILLESLERVLIASVSQSSPIYWLSLVLMEFYHRL